MSQILITGGAGAIGSNLAAALVARDNKVVVLDDLSSGHRALLPHGVPLIEGSITDDSALAEAFAGGIDYVFHLAALFANQNSVDHPEADLDANGRGTLKVLEHACRAGVRKLLFSSSSCVYGNKPVMTEDNPDFQLNTPYAITKLLGEHYCKFWVEHHGMNVVILRLFNTYGPHEYPGPYRNVIPNFFARAMKGETLIITGTGDETRDFTFVEDTVRGMLGAMFAETVPGDIFNIASGQETRIVDVATMINEIAGNAAGIVFQPRRAWDSVSRRRGDIGKAQATFGYRPRVSLREGLERTHAWLRSVTGADG